MNIKWTDKPVADASDPVYAGNKITFRSAADVEDIYAGCARVGLKVLKIEGLRRYGSILCNDGTCEYHVVGGAYGVRVFDPTGRAVFLETSAEENAAAQKLADDIEFRQVAKEDVGAPLEMPALTEAVVCEMGALS